MERLEFTPVDKECWHRYPPIIRRLTNWEVWAMNMVFECLAHEVNNETKYEVNKGDTFRVKDDCFVYNSEYTVRNDNGAKARMYLAKDGILVLEFRSERGQTEELYICR